MWGDSERAITLDSSDPLAAVLFQVTGPAHIPWQDPRWQELLHGYNVWVHLEFYEEIEEEPKQSSSPSKSPGKDNPKRTVNHPKQSVLAQACQSLLQHAPRTSNLAALALHVTRMLRDVLPTTGSHHEDSESHSHQSEPSSSPVDLGAVELFSNRIALVGKARAVAGALNLLRILCHAVIVQQTTLHHSSNDSPSSHSRHPSSDDDDAYLEQIFTYQSRDNATRHVDTAADLISALCQFLVSPLLLRQYSNNHHFSDVPELYDTTVQCLQLLLVLFSPQLYQPMVSSFQRRTSPSQTQQSAGNYSNDFFANKFWKKALEKAEGALSSEKTTTYYKQGWTPQRLVLTCLEWHMTRPRAPDKSIAHYMHQLAQSVVQAKGERLAADGMYENHQVVLAAAPRPDNPNNPNHAHGNSQLLTRTGSSSKLILDATKGVLVLSSTLILLPFRLVRLAFSLWGHKEKGFDKAVKGQLATHMMNYPNASQSRTKDALWLSDSTVADLSTCLLLLLVNNNRAALVDPKDRKEKINPFREALARLSDNRWEMTDAASALPDLPDFMDPTLANQNHNNIAMSTSDDEEEEKAPLVAPSFSTAPRPLVNAHQDETLSHCLVNFESLFESFSLVAHTELGALFLYTLLQASKSFAESVAVRSDLDNLVVPLLRTLYFASSSRHFIDASNYSKSANNKTGKDSNKLSLRSCPFRSPSQLYVIIILLLLLSQDASFGADAFRRIKIPVVPFYKERNLKEISLGSLLVLSLLRHLTFNLNRLGDPFLLSNCCAILMNLSNSVTGIHDYAAMRLVSVTISTMKKYSNLHKQNPNAAKEDPSSEASMYCEVSRTLLRVLRQCLDAKAVEGNLHLVYALVYHYTDLARVLSIDGSPFRPGETCSIENVAKAGATIVDKHGARAAAVALKVLAENSADVREASAANGSSGKKQSSKAGGEDFTFTYEEEADPEVFFVPYCWEVIVCSVTAGTIGWRKKSIQVFSLLDEELEDDNDQDYPNDLPEVVAQGFAKDVSDVV